MNDKFEVTVDVLIKYLLWGEKAFQPNELATIRQVAIQAGDFSPAMLAAEQVMFARYLKRELSQQDGLEFQWHYMGNEQSAGKDRWRRYCGE